MNWEKEPIKVNKIIGKQAGFGPIPANQILPWFAIITITYFIFDGLLSWGIPRVAVISFWLILSWWFVTGKIQINTLIFFVSPKVATGLSVVQFIYLLYFLGISESDLRRQGAGSREQGEEKLFLDKQMMKIIFL